MRFGLLFFLNIVFLSACVSKTLPVVLDPKNPEMVKQGETLYLDNCARCHGVNLEGQANWRSRKPDGKLPAPPHDASGHTWHHPNAMLIEIVRNGMVEPHAPAGYQSDMPAFKGKISDAQIAATLSYIQSRWPEDVWQYRLENKL